MCNINSDLLDAIDSPLVRLSDEQRSQVGHGNSLGSLQGGMHGCSAHQVVVDTRDLAVNGPPRHYTHLKTL